MTTASWALAVAAATFAVTDWWAVWVDRARVRYVAKPATLAALIGVALTLDPSVDPTVRTWTVAGLVLSLAGDVFLMLDERWFLAGLGSFLLGHVAYVVGLQLAPTSVAGTLVGLAAVGVAIATVGRRIVAGVAGDHRELVVPVIAYLVVISAMVVSAAGTEAPWAVVGAALFYASDATLAWNRFLEPRRRGPLAVMVTYHLGQAGLVVWLVTG